MGVEKNCVRQIDTMKHYMYICSLLSLFIVEQRLAVLFYVYSYFWVY